MIEKKNLTEIKYTNTGHILRYIIILLVGDACYQQYIGFMSKRFKNSFFFPQSEQFEQSFESVFDEIQTIRQLTTVPKTYGPLWEW